MATIINAELVSTDVIRIAGLKKHFGKVRALDGLDLTVGAGEIFGFLGPNGAGKSTTIFVLLDLLRPTAGSVEVLGHDPRRHGPQLRAQIGYLPGELRMPEHRTAGYYLEYLARLRRGRGRDQIESLAERFDLDLSRQIGKLSKGNKQKIGLVQAFMHQPELLILDEPTSGLDPLLQHQFQDLARERTQAGATVFMSSHMLSEIEDIAGRVAIIRAGRLVDVDDLQTLRQRAGREVVLWFEDRVVADGFSMVEGVSDLSVTDDPQTGGSVLRCTLRGVPDGLLKAAATHRVIDWRAGDRQLDDLFLDFYRQDDDRKVLEHV